MTKILHVVPGLDDPSNGISVAAKLIAGGQGADLVDVRTFNRSDIRSFGRYAEIWVHSMWLPQTLRACWRIAQMPDGSNGRPKLVRMLHGNLDPVRLAYHGWKKRLVGPIERGLLKRCDRLVATCTAEKGWIQTYVGKDCPEIATEDLKRFFNVRMFECSECSKSGKGSLRLLYLGRRHPLKGVEFLERAVTAFNQSYEHSEHSNIRTVELRRVSDHFGEELERDWDWCDVLVLPTLSENFGLVVAEALERGKRVITTDGAPAWGEGTSDFGGRLIYLRGYRDGTDRKRVALLKEALGMIAGGEKSEDNLTVVHVCPDTFPSSGVNCFCTQLNDALGSVQGLKFKVQSFVVRSFADLLLQTSKLNGQSSDARLVLHIHGLWLRDHHRAAVWARRHGVPVVWSAHGMTSPWAMRNRWWKKLPAWWLYQRRDLRAAALLHATSEQEMEWNRRAGLKNRQILAPLGTNSPILQSNNRTIQQSNNFTVLFDGRIHPVKGLANLVRAAASLDRTIRVRIVGPDEGGHLSELRGLCADGGASVSFVGEKHGAELEREYETCDVLVLPSFTENFGGVVVDALAHGKPVIASTFTPWKCLEEFSCGWWIANSPESLAKAIQSAAKLPRERLAEMGERGRRLVAERFTWEAVAKKMAEEYRGIV